MSKNAKATSLFGAIMAASLILCASGCAKQETDTESAKRQSTMAPDAQKARLQEERALPPVDPAAAQPPPAAAHK